MAWVLWGLEEEQAWRAGGLGAREVGRNRGLDTAVEVREALDGSRSWSLLHRQVWRN